MQAASTNKQRIAMSLQCLLLSCLLLTSLFARAADETFSSANTALFASNHLQNVAVGDTLVYDFKQSAPEQTAIQDTITLTMKEQAGHRQLKVDYLSGERQRWVPEFDDPSGNPVLMLFLQSDITQLEQLTGGQWRHFQKYIKLALEKPETTLESVDIEFHSQQLKGQKISIQPYQDDPYRDRFKNTAYLRKQYDFILSAAIPGGIYKISAYVPAEQNAKPEPLVITELQLR